jgi:indolepyruvate ferredoxin oxidoreductase
MAGNPARLGNEYPPILGRRLIGEYEVCIDELLQGLTAERLPLAVEIARLPEEIRGFGHVKARHLAAVRPKWARLMSRWRDAEALRAAA